MVQNRDSVPAVADINLDPLVALFHRLAVGGHRVLRRVVPRAPVRDPPFFRLGRLVGSGSRFCARPNCGASKTSSINPQNIIPHINLFFILIIASCDLKLMFSASSASLRCTSLIPSTTDTAFYFAATWPERLTHLPSLALRYPAIMVSSTILPSSGVSFGGVSFSIASTMLASSSG